MPTLRTLVCLGLVLGLVTGCGGKKKEITSLQRKEAATLDSEAQFALTLKDYARAEGLLAKAAELTPDNADLWLRLGMTRMRIEQREPARAAYKRGLDALREAAAEQKDNADLLLQQVTALALLGRQDEAKKLVEKLGKDFPQHRAVRAFIDGRTLDRMLADPQFKALAL